MLQHKTEDMEFRYVLDGDTNEILDDRFYGIFGPGPQASLEFDSRELLAGASPNPAAAFLDIQTKDLLGLSSFGTNFDFDLRFDDNTIDLDSVYIRSTLNTTTVSEPSLFALLAVSIAAVGCMKRRKIKGLSTGE